MRFRVAGLWRIAAVPFILALTPLAQTPAWPGGSCSGCGGGGLAMKLNDAFNEMFSYLRAPNGQTGSSDRIEVSYEKGEPPIQIQVRDWDHAFHGAAVQVGDEILIHNPDLTNPNQEEDAECKGNSETHLVGCIVGAFHGKPAEQVCRMIVHEAARIFPQEIPRELENRYLVSKALMTDNLRQDRALLAMCQDISQTAQELWEQNHPSNFPARDVALAAAGGIGVGAVAYHQISRHLGPGSGVKFDWPIERGTVRFILRPGSEGEVRLLRPPGAWTTVFRGKITGVPVSPDLEPARLTQLKTLGAEPIFIDQGKGLAAIFSAIPPKSEFNRYSHDWYARFYFIEPGGSTAGFLALNNKYQIRGPGHFSIHRPHASLIDVKLRNTSQTPPYVADRLIKLAPLPSGATGFESWRSEQTNGALETEETLWELPAKSPGNYGWRSCIARFLNPGRGPESRTKNR